MDYAEYDLSVRFFLYTSIENKKALSKLSLGDNKISSQNRAKTTFSIYGEISYVAGSKCNQLYAQ